MKLNIILASAAMLCATSLTACTGSKANQEKIADTAVDAVEETTETAGATGDPAAMNDMAADNDSVARRINSGKWIKLPSGLEYQVLEKGNGPKPTANDEVSVIYTGYLTDGTIFDATSLHGGEPYTSFPLNRVIPGWTEGVQLMPVGSTYRFRIPYNLAYGEQGMGPIPPKATLIFDVKLVKIGK